MKRIVINGATSILGVALIKECLNDNIEVIAIVHSNSKNLKRIPKSDHIQIIEKNLDELADYVPANEADVFYHFAWTDTTSHETRINFEKQASNIRYTLDAVHLANRFDCKKFIFAGSQSECGLTDKPISSGTSIRPFTAYGVSKFAAGKMSGLLCQSLGLDFAWGRILSIYGIDDNPNTLISYIIDCYRKGIQPILTPCEQIWDYLYCDDAARAFKLMGEKKSSGMYCVGSGVGKPLKSYVETIYNLMKPDVPLEFGGKSYSENQVMYLQADISDLQRDTGFNPSISFEEGISRIINSLTR